MPSILPNEKSHIKSVLGAQAEILAAAVARLYFASPDPQKWAYQNVCGPLVLYMNNEVNSFFLDIVDMQSGRVAFSQELYREFQYRQERTFFHAFPGDKYMIGLSFADEAEASMLFEKMMNRDTQYSKKSRPMSVSGSNTSSSSPPVSSGHTSLQLTSSPSISSSSSAGTIRRKSTKEKSKKGKINKTAISSPSNFQHLSHIGYDPEAGFSMTDIPAEWRLLFDKAGVTEEQLKNKSTAKFIVDFVQSRGGPPPAVPNPRGSVVSSSPPSTAPPPPPTAMGAGSGGRNPPPPPPPGSSSMRGTAPPPPVPSMPASNGGFGSAPPPPPPPPPSSAGPRMSAGEPGNASAPFSHGNATNNRTSQLLPPAGSGAARNDLLASIRNGNITLNKVDISEQQQQPPVDDRNDMAGALAKALAQRKDVMQHSDDEEESAEGDW